MAKGLVTDTSIKNIADVIRTFNGTSDKYTPSEMAAEMIDAIPSSAPVLTTSGESVHITDAAASPAEECVTVFEPKQDLHGYDKPWPAGGGKNLLPLNFSEIVSLNTLGVWQDNVYTYNGLTMTIEKNEQNAVTAIIMNGTATAVSYFYLIDNFRLNEGIYIWFSGVNGETDGTQLYLNRINDDAWYSYESRLTLNSDTDYRLRLYCRAGATPTNLVYKPMIRRASETDDTFEPYSNICPISGYTNVELIRTGKNLLKITAESHTANGITFTVNKDDAGNVVSVTANGTAQGDFSAFLLSTQLNYDSWKKFLGESIVFSGCPAGGSLSTYRMQYWQSDNLQYHEFGNGVTFDFPNPPSNQFNFAIFITSGYTANNLVFKPMIRLASDTDDTFEPYQDSVHTADWQSTAGTVYGGEVDWANGVLRVDKAKYTFKNTDVWTAKGTKSWGTSCVDNNIKPNANNDTVSDIQCDIFNASSPNDVWQGKNNNTINIAISSDWQRIRIYNVDLVGKTESEVAEFMTGKTIVYPLATPIEISLTSEIITMLKGVNSLWSDNGETSVSYIADLGLYINGLKERAREAISG